MFIRCYSESGVETKRVIPYEHSSLRFRHKTLVHGIHFKKELARSNFGRCQSGDTKRDKYLFPPNMAKLQNARFLLGMRKHTSANRGTDAIELILAGKYHSDMNLRFDLPCVQQNWRAMQERTAKIEKKVRAKNKGRRSIVKATHGDLNMRANASYAPQLRKSLV